MASKREEQMSAKYAEVVERNKQLERQNAEYAAEIERLKSRADNGASVVITKDELRQIMAETLTSQKEIIDKTTRLLRRLTLMFAMLLKFFISLLKISISRTSAMKSQFSKNLRWV